MTRACRHTGALSPTQIPHETIRGSRSQAMLRPPASYYIQRLWNRPATCHAHAPSVLGACKQATNQQQRQHSQDTSNGTNLLCKLTPRAHAHSVQGAQQSIKSALRHEKRRASRALSVACHQAHTPQECRSQTALCAPQTESAQRTGSRTPGSGVISRAGYQQCAQSVQGVQPGIKPAQPSSSQNTRSEPMWYKPRTPSVQRVQQGIKPAEHSSSQNASSGTISPGPCHPPRGGDTGADQRVSRATDGGSFPSPPTGKDLAH